MLNGTNHSATAKAKTNAPTVLPAMILTASVFRVKTPAMPAESSKMMVKTRNCPIGVGVSANITSA